MNNDEFREMCRAVDEDDADRARRILVEHPEEVTGFYGPWSWVHYAADDGRTRVVGAFLDAGLDVNWAPRDPGRTLLVGAVDYGRLETAKYLLSRGANPNLGRCLIAAINADANSFDLVKLLVEHGVDVNQVWRFGDEERGHLFNALSWAVDAERHDVAEYLRAHGAVMPPEEPRRSYASSAEEIVAYFERRFGRVDPQALREIVPTSDPPILIHRIRATEERDSLILFTTGMSDLAMDVPQGGEEYRYAELLIELPGDWPLAREALADPKNRWPVEWLRRAGSYPHAERTWFGGPVATMSNSDPPSPLAPDSPFTALLLTAGYDNVGPIVMSDGRRVQVYTLTPLYENELQLALSQGLAELFRRLDQFQIGGRVDLTRQSVAGHS